MSRIVSGDKSAEDALVRRYWRSLHFILLKETGEQSLAQDLVQDAFAVVIRKARAGEIDNPDALSAFIRQTAINLLIAYRRKQTRQNTFSTEDIDIAGPVSDVVPEQVNRQQLLKLVEQTLQEMSMERDRQLLMQYFVYGADKQTVCAQLNLTAEYFDKVLHRARKRLKQKLLMQLGVDVSEQSLNRLLFTLLVFLPVV